MRDIRLYLQRGKRGFTQDTLRTSNKITLPKEDSDPIDNLKNIRDKMTASKEGERSPGNPRCSCDKEKEDPAKDMERRKADTCI